MQANNQATYQRIRKAIAEPYARIYGELHPDMLDDLVEDLSSYSEDVLASGWKEVRRTRKSKPTIAHIIEACEKAAEKGVKSASNNENLPWIIADRKAEELLNSYLKTVMSNATFKEAQAGNYEVELYSFIKAIATYQAQRIAGVTNPEISWFDIFGWDRASGGNAATRKEMQAFLRRQDEQIATGQIGVSVPLELLRNWQKKHEGETPFMERQFEAGSLGAATQRLITLRKAGKTIQDEPKRAWYHD